MLFADAGAMPFPTAAFEVALCGFMGWSDCFDFAQGEFTQPNTKAEEIWRVLEEGGRFVCCSWEDKRDLSWMEEAIIRHYPAILEDGEFLNQRPIGMAKETAAGYEIIFDDAGFREIAISRMTATFVSTDKEEWWRQMLHLDWAPFIEKIEKKGADQLQRVKGAIFEELQGHKQVDGICFEKWVTLVRGVK